MFFIYWLLTCRFKQGPRRAVTALVAAAIAGALWGGTAQAQSFTSTGATDDYQAASNWSPTAGAQPTGGLINLANDTGHVPVKTITINANINDGITPGVMVQQLGTSVLVPMAIPAAR
ncbi:hypothetical protein [Bradyrhizobium genosp. P]|uniref:hypothetical protein n=1 Tax=Bradyrhizobium genosp. P TaxID=83641 RepID=UPI003CEBB30E